MARILTAKEVAKALVDAGVLPEDHHARRIIIDVEVDKPVRLYIERYADENLLRVELPRLNGIEINYTPKPKPDDTPQE